MMLNTKVLRGLISSLLIFAISAAAFADTIRLKDGSIIKGKIIGFGGGKFVVVMGEGSRRREMSFAANEVESINFDEVQPAAVTTRTAAYKPPEKAAEKQPEKAVDPVETEKVVTNNDPKPVDPTPSSAPPRKPAGGSVQPIAWSVKVTADNTANGWTNTGWVVKKGQRIRISGDGKISLGHNQSATASGLPTLDDPQKLLKSVPTGALIAVVGDDNNDFIYIGASREFTASRDGALFLGINEGNLNDNSGAFNVKVEIIPDGTE